MSVVPVAQLGEPVLRTVADPVADPSGGQIRDLAADMHDTLLHWRATTTYGRGIAAPQVGASLRVIVVDLGDERQVLVNPEVVAASSDQRVWWDACLSCLHVFGQVRRSAGLKLDWFDEQGVRHDKWFGAELAELLEHELDHLDGVVYLDRVFDTHTLCERSVFEARHRPNSPYASPDRG